MFLSFFFVVIRGDLGSRTQRENFQKSATRKHFITRQDCRNIVRKLKDFSNHRHTDDAVSIDHIVCELSLENPSPIICYKPQGFEDPHLALPSDTFFLCIMTEFQVQLFEEFCSKIVCLDSTHQTNQYRHKLITLMVVDEFHNGNLYCLICCMIYNELHLLNINVTSQDVQ